MSHDFEFDEEQLRLGQSARDLFAQRSPIGVVRELEAAGQPGFSPELWREMAELGWLGIAVPESHGGSGAGLLDLFPIYEEMGRFLVPSPHLDTVGVAAPALLELGDAAQQEQYLPAIVSGDCIVSLAVLEADGGFGPDSIRLTARADGSGYTLQGTKLLVGWVPSADRLLVLARTGEEENAISAFLVDPTSDGVSTSGLTTISGAPLYAVELADVSVSADARLGVESGAWDPMADIMLQAAVLQTATVIGAARAVLEMTNQYAQDREQFGVPIGSFQAVQYLVTDILLDLHRMDLLARHAAFRIHHGLPARREAAMAVAFGKEAAAHLHRQAHEVHAGVAFIHEHDLTLYSRRSKYWENNLGDARHHRELVNAANGI